MVYFGRILRSFLAIIFNEGKLLEDMFPMMKIDRDNRIKC